MNSSAALRTTCLVFLALLTQSVMLPSRAESAAGVAGFLGVVPGLGHVYNGKPGEGLAWLGTIAALYGVGLTQTGSKFTVAGQTKGEQWEFFPQAAFDIYLYSIYDAYRDAKPQSRKYSEQSVFLNFAESINPLNLWDPITAVVVGGAALGGSRHGYSGLTNWKRPLYFSVVSLGEESFTRGFLFPAFSDLFKSRWAGAILSSFGFVALHLTNGVEEAFEPTAAATRFGFGMLMCWQMDRNRYRLGKSIFAHTWYNLLVTPISSRAGIPDGLAVQTKIQF